MLAPAGSGKTQTIVNRVLMNLKNGLAAPRILILTFDNAAVTSLRDKSRAELTKLRISQTQSPVISTINAFGYGILREFVPEEYKTIAPDYRRRRLLREVKGALREISPERFSALPSYLQDEFYLEPIRK